MAWTDGSYYSGQFSSSQICGVGRFVKHDGTIYVGEFRNNMASGFGTLETSAKTIFEGEFQDDLPEGICIERSEGLTHMGEYLSGKKEGLIKSNWLDGRIYYGNYVDNQINGIVTE